MRLSFNKPGLLAAALGLLVSHAALAKKHDPVPPEPAPSGIEELTQHMAPQPQTAVVGKSFPLEQALAAAYSHNPDLEAARAALRATDEQHAQAVAGFRPSLSGTASYSSSTQDGNKGTRTSADPKTLALTVTQPVYNGGSTLASVRQADNTIRAGRASLLVTEQTVLLAAVTAYTNVLRDREIVDLDINNENVLKNHLDAARAQFRLGSITKTDVSQAEARLAAAVAARVAAEGDLKVSRADFEKVVGAPPDGLLKPVLNAPLPGTQEEALAEALARNPALLEARFLAEAAQDRTRAVRGELLPSVDLEGGISRSYDPATGLDDYIDGKSVLVQATIPLYGAGGGTYSRVREARQIEVQRRRETDSAERAVRQAVIDAWETLAAANARNEAQTVQVRAEKMARDGVAVEAHYGSRTTLNLLDAEQEYLAAEVASVSSERDKAVAVYGLLAAVGRLTAEDLKLDVQAYDPLRHFESVKGKWAGTQTTP